MFTYLQYNTIQLYCLCVEKFALLTYVKHHVYLLTLSTMFTYLLTYLLLLLADEVDDDNPTKVETSRQTVIRVAVHSKHVGTVIGPQGATIKRVR